MTASVDILTNRKDKVLSVPLAAVTTRDPNSKEMKEGPDQQGGQASSNRAEDPKKVQKKTEKVVVFVNDNGKAKMVEVKTGISDYDNIEILEGISDSTQVVVGPFLAVSKRLKEGDAIKQMVKKKEEKKDESK